MRRLFSLMLLAGSSMGADFTHGIAVALEGREGLVEAAHGHTLRCCCTASGGAAEWQFAHKTGSSGSVDGVTLAFNDVGMVQVPKGPVAYLSSKSAN